MNSRLTDLEKELMVARGKRRGEGKVGEYEMDMYTLLHLRWITNRGLLYSIRNCAECMWQPGWEWGLGEIGHV